MKYTLPKITFLLFLTARVTLAVLDCSGGEQKALQDLAALTPYLPQLHSFWSSIPVNPCDPAVTRPNDSSEAVECTGGSVSLIKLRSVGLTGPLPDTLACLSGLTALLVPENSLTSLPAAMASVQSLVEIDVAGNVGLALGDLTGLTSLKSLKLSIIGLTAFPMWILDQTGLEELWIDMNAIPVLPAELGTLTSLSHLDASHNGFTEMPAGLATSPTLKSLNLGQNQLTDLPEVWTAPLESLYVYGNKLTALPCLDISSLHTIIANDNSLTSLPACRLGGPSISQIHLSMNPGLSELPAEFSQYTVLSNIFLDYCGFSEFPEVLCDVGSVGVLRISNNGLDEIPECVSTMNLHTLISDHNPLSRLPTSMPISLTRWISKGSGATHIPGGMSNLNYLQWPDNAQLVDTSGLADATQLLRLFLERATSLHTLSDLPQSLIKLSIEESAVEDVGFLKDLPALEEFSARFTRITSVPTPAAALRAVNVSMTCLHDVSPISATSMRPVLAECTYVAEGTPNVDVSAANTLIGCPWLHCANARQDPVVPGTEETAFSQFGPCRAGYECSGIGPGTFCAEGKYSLGGASECSDVPIHYYTPATRDELLICPPGHTCAGGSAHPDPCPENTYKALEGEGECLPCNEGLHSPAGSSQCGVCFTTGVYHDGSVCRTCERGYRCHGDDSRIACDGIGEYNDVTGASACKMCPAGTVPSTDRTTCVLPPAGSIVIDGSVAPCTGELVDGECLPCPYDHTCADGVATPYVTDCTGTTLEGLAAELYSSLMVVADTSDPDPCFWDGISCDSGSLAGGFQVDLVGLAAKGTLPPNIGCFGSALTYLALYDVVGPVHGGVPRSINNLTALTYFDVDEVALTGPVPPLDQMAALEVIYMQGTALSGPLPPLPNALYEVYLTDSCFTGQPTPMLATGSLLEYFLAECTALQEGDEWSRDMQLAVSTALTPYNLQWTELTERSKCILPSCNPCGAGEYTTTTPLECLTCEAGYKCRDGVKTICPAGTWSGTGATTCRPCATGTFSTDEGRTTECTATPANGEIVSPFDRTQTVVCGAGTHTNADHTACVPAAAGRYTPGGDTEPALCPRGTYQDSSAQGFCLSVGLGECQDEEGATTPKTVPAGSYTILATRDVLNECPKGHMCAGLDAQPEFCSTGKFQPNKGQDECLPNLGGSFIVDLETRDATALCPAGSFCSGGDAQPEVCSAGTFALAGATVCTVCPAGEASPEGASACSPCAGFTESTFCMKTELPGGTAILVPRTCPEGSYIAGDDRQECRKCSADYNCDGTAEREFTLAPFSTFDPTTVSGFLTVMVVVFVLVGSAGGTMFALTLKKRTQAAIPAVNTELGELVVV